MNPILLDTSGLISLVNTDDQWHGDANSTFLSLLKSNRQWFVTSLVLIEIGDGLSRISLRRLAVELRATLVDDSQVRVIELTTEYEQQAWELFQQRPDKNWGMTDCVSMVVMSDHDITEVFSRDHHFEQTGFPRVFHGL